MRGASLKNRKGQVTIFIIIAIVVIVAGVLIYAFYPEVTSTLSSLEENPKLYIQDCVEDTLQQNIELVSSQGGSIDPEFSFGYEGNYLEYLCYTNDYYVPCNVQRPLLSSHIEKELKASIEEKVNSCFDSMIEDYANKGYSPRLEKGNFSVELFPNKVIANIQNKLTLTKESVENYDSFDVVVDNNLYELVSIARGIVSWEVKYGDSEVTLFENYFPNMKVEKHKQGDGTKIYIVTDRNSQDRFQFASRSVAWAPGVPIPKIDQ